MKQSLFVVFLLVLFCSACRDKDKKISGLMQESDKEAVVYGSADFEHQSFVSLTVHGRSTLEDVIVKDKFVAYGSSDIEDCELNTVVIYGATSINDTNIVGTVDIFGKADFESCSLKNVEFSGEEVVFDECNLSQLTIKGKGEDSLEQLVVLNDTKVEQSIIFENRHGVVKLEGDSSIKGRVIGGSVID